MLSDERIEAAIEVFQLRIERVKDKYLRLVGEHIAKIGKISATDLNLIEQLRRLDVNIRTIEAELAAALRINTRDVQAMLEAAAKSVYKDAGIFYDQTKFADNFTMKTILAGQTFITQGKLTNLSQTRIISTAYRSAVDDAVTAIQSGVTNYTKAIEGALKEVANDGIRIRYPSGVTRRVDTAMRQNILDGVRSINQRIAQQVGTEFDADGVEISAHADCAPDHVDIQGRQYTRDEYERLNDRLERPIGELNCKHFAFPIIIGVSSPSRSEEELNKINEQSTQKISIDGKEKTWYNWSQELRGIETAVRYQKDAANIATAAGATDMARQATANIKALRKEYRKITSATGIPTQYDRMRVAGYIPVK